MDLFELNEAFAAQSLAVIKELGLDTKKVGVFSAVTASTHLVFHTCSLVPRPKTGLGTRLPHM